MGSDDLSLPHQKKPQKKLYKRNKHKQDITYNKTNHFFSLKNNSLTFISTPLSLSSFALLKMEADFIQDMQRFASTFFFFYN